jgi:hypothetical protein
MEVRTGQTWAMTKLVETSSGTWACSECGKEIPVPTRGPTTEEKGDLHLLAFDQHVAEAHKKISPQ